MLSNVPKRGALLTSAYKTLLGSVAWQDEEAEFHITTSMWHGKRVRVEHVNRMQRCCDRKITECCRMFDASWVDDRLQLTTGDKTYRSTLVLQKTRKDPLVKLVFVNTEDATDTFVWHAVWSQLTNRLLQLVLFIIGLVTVMGGVALGISVSNRRHEDALNAQLKAVFKSGDIIEQFLDTNRRFNKVEIVRDEEGLKSLFGKSRWGRVDEERQKLGLREEADKIREKLGLREEAKKAPTRPGSDWFPRQ